MTGMWAEPDAGAPRQALSLLPLTQCSGAAGGGGRKCSELSAGGVGRRVAWGWAGAWAGPRRWLWRLPVRMGGNPGVGAGLRCDLDLCGRPGRGRQVGPSVLWASGSDPRGPIGPVKVSRIPQGCVSEAVAAGGWRQA